MMHELQMHERAAFITLTYDEDSLPYPPSLSVLDWQLFAKRLRKNRHPFRFYMCGEYGDKNRRPHYHAIIFGLDFPDQIIIDKNHRGEALYDSPSLAKIWKHGMVRVAPVTFETCAYVARYVTKKITGEQALEHYTWTHNDTDFFLKPEFSLSSSQPGIGIPWLRKYHQDVFTHDLVVSRNHPAKPPRAYDKKLQEWSLITTEYWDYEAIKKSRAAKAPKPSTSSERIAQYYGIGFADNSPDRVGARSEVYHSRAKLLKRSL